MTPVIVCTKHRAVVFGYAEGCIENNAKLKNARMCLFWPASIGGVFGLGEIGPNKETRVSATLEELDIRDVTAVFSVSAQAEEAWNNAPIQGR